jgi:hypothetical protein
MPDQELIDDFLEALEAAGSPVPNPDLRDTLGWPEAQYEEVKAELGLPEFKLALSLSIESDAFTLSCCQLFE